MVHARLTGILLAFCVPATAAAEPQPVRGSGFITLMQGNTVSGTSRSGAAFNMYFLPDGVLTYEDSAGARDRGTWSIDADGDVCVAWEKPADHPKGCYRVAVDGSRITWRGKGGSGSATLRGGIADTFLKAGKK
ncbi:MAG: hypothetical protein L6R19_21435 [Alphaproteobacteria bacterium]|nr:hypothetical protein [Alphaproteobacteria bacterium]